MSGLVVPASVSVATLLTGGGLPAKAEVEDSDVLPPVAPVEDAR